MFRFSPGECGSLQPSDGGGGRHGGHAVWGENQGSILCEGKLRKPRKSCDNKQQEMDVGNSVLRAVKVYKESLKKESECQCWHSGWHWTWLSLLALDTTRYWILTNLRKWESGQRDHLCWLLLTVLTNVWKVEGAVILCQQPTLSKVSLIRFE